ncbi:MAG: 3-deoxy-7-phosphoheptulonate synthase [Betaproteobacteria bacterium]|nr:3-deoxy-7-phosphoheptulonate synthase [Betaproteobacteria bacterium]
MAIELRILGRHQADEHDVGFSYNGVEFRQDRLVSFLGLNSVDTREFVEQTFACLKALGQTTARMGAYKPRTSPYSFQGMGKECLPWMFELAGKYGIRVVAMEVTREAHVEEVFEALRATGNPTGVMLQIGTRNTQNFELLKAVGRQQEFPILLKRGFGITLDESLMAAEYCASEGNARIVFGLRGMKTNLGDPHRNLVDFAHVPVVHRLTRMPVCVDPSHSVGNREVSPDGIPDVYHAAAQGVIAGANMLLVDVHPVPNKALVDAGQALSLEELPRFLEDVAIARAAFERRRALFAPAP